MTRLPGVGRTYLSFDKVMEDVGGEEQYPIEYINGLAISGLPPHKLELKINSPVMLLRNVNPDEGLCNGTRLMVKSFGLHFIEAEIIGGAHGGQRHFLPRVALTPSDTGW